MKYRIIRRSNRFSPDIYVIQYKRLFIWKDIPIHFGNVLDAARIMRNIKDGLRYSTYQSIAIRTGYKTYKYIESKEIIIKK